jgi:predicted dehydrogenase
MPDQISIGIVGAGSNVRDRHVPGLRAQPGVRLRGVANSSLESSERAAAEFGVDRAYGDWRELVADPGIDAVVIGTWPNLHAEVTIAALEVGKHVLCEARMALNFADATRMLAASRGRPELVTQVVPSPFGLGADQTLRRLIAEDYLGAPYSLRVFGSTRQFASPGRPPGPRDQRRYMGVNALDLGLWYEPALRWWGHATSVFARAQHAVTTLRDPATGAAVPVDSPDQLDAIASYPDGSQGVFTATRISGLSASPGAWLFGSAGTLHYDLRTQTLEGGRVGDQALTPIGPGDAGDGWRVEAEFIGAIRGAEPVAYTTFADGARYMAFTEAVRRSAELGAPVPVPQVDARGEAGQGSM